MLKYLRAESLASVLSNQHSCIILVRQRSSLLASHSLFSSGRIFRSHTTAFISSMVGSGLTLSWYGIRYSLGGLPGSSVRLASSQ